MSLVGTEITFCDCCSPQVEERVAVRTKNENIPFDVWSIVGTSEEAQMVPFRVLQAAIRCQPEAAVLTRVVVEALESSGHRTVPDDTCVPRLVTWWRSRQVKRRRDQYRFVEGPAVENRDI